MKCTINISTELSKIYIEAARFLGISVEEVLYSVLEEYVVNLIKQKKKALN